MKFVAEIDVMPSPDPLGSAVAGTMKNVPVEGVTEVRIGKHIALTLEAESDADAREKVETTCKKLLANMIMETYSFSLHPAG